MPRVSSAAKDLSAGGFVREGLYRILAACYACYAPTQSEESIKKGEKPTDPFIVMHWTVEKVNEDLKPISDKHDEIRLGIAWPRKDANKNAVKNKDGNFVFQLTPANASSADDMEPELLGEVLDDGNFAVEAGTEGNCIWASDQYKIWDESPWGRMVTTMEKDGGLKPEINAQGYAPGYVGMVIDFKTIELPKTGREKNPNQAPTALVCRRIVVYPGQEEKKASSGKGAGKGASAGKGGTNGQAGKASTVAPPAAASSGSNDKVTAAVAGFLKANKGKTFARTDFQKELSLAIMGAQVGMKDTQAFINSQIKPDAGIMAFAMENGLELNDEGTEVTL